MAQPKRINSLEIITLAISMAALCFSGLSWRESRKSGESVQATSRANISIGPANLNLVSGKSRYLSDEVQVVLEIENVGQSTALDIDVSCDVLITEATLKGESISRGFPEEDTEKSNIHFLAPHKLQPVLCYAKIPPLAPADKNKFFPAFVSAALHYKDEATGQSFSSSQNFASCLLGRQVMQSPMSQGEDGEWDHTMVSAIMKSALDKALSKAKKNREKR